MGRVHMGPSDGIMTQPALIDETGFTSEIVYIDRPVEVIREVPVVVKEIEWQERIVYLDRPVEVMVEVVKEVVNTEYIDRIVEVPTIVKIVDIEELLSLKRILRSKDKHINKLYLAIGFTAIASLIIGMMVR